MVLKCQSGLTQSKEKAWLRSGLGERQVAKQLADVQVGLEIWHLVVCGPNSYVTINVHLIANNHQPSVEVVEHHLCFYIFHRLIKITFIFVIFSIAHCSFLITYLCFVLCLKKLTIRGVVFMATILPVVHLKKKKVLLLFGSKSTHNGIWISYSMRKSPRVPFMPWKYLLWSKCYSWAFT